MIEKYDRFLKNHHQNDDVFILSNLGKRVHGREGVGVRWIKYSWKQLKRFSLF